MPDKVSNPERTKDGADVPEVAVGHCAYHEDFVTLRYHREQVAALTQEVATLKAERDFFAAQVNVNQDGVNVVSAILEERSQLRGDKERLVAMLDQLTSACWYNGREVGQPVLRAPDSHTLTCAIETVDSFAAPEDRKWADQDHRWEYEAQGLLEPEKLADGQDGPEDQAQTIAALTQEVATLKAELDEEQRAKYGTPCRCESWIETCRLAEERAEALDAALARLEAERDTAIEQFTEHTKAVGRFLYDMYATMIDPVEECNLKVAELCELLLKQAGEDREQLAALATLRSENESKWISAKERLPEDGVEVLACLGALVNVDDGFASRYVAWLDYDTQPPQWIIAGNVTNGITHWQPLPTPPAHGPTSTEEKADGNSE